MVLIEILCISIATIVASQPESFEQQDEREQQYQYDSRYYAKPEQTRATMGKFLLFKMKGEIRNDNTYDPFLSNQYPSFGQSGIRANFKFPSFPFSSFRQPTASLTNPSFSNPLYRIFSPLGHTETSGGGKFISITKIFAGLSTKKPAFLPEIMSGNMEKIWDPYTTNVDHPIDLWSPFDSNLETPLSDLQITHSLQFHQPNFKEFHTLDESPEENEDDKYPEDEQIAKASMKQEEIFDPFLNRYSPPEKHQKPIQAWSTRLKLNKENMKNKEQTVASYNWEEPNRYKCHCKPFIQEPIIKKCTALFCAIMPYKRA